MVFENGSQTLPPSPLPFLAAKRLCMLQSAVLLRRSAWGGMSPHSGSRGKASLAVFYYTALN